MKSIVNVMIIALIMVLLPNLSFAKPVKLQSRYICENKDPFSGNTYKGALLIQQTGELSYSFAWDYGKDKQYIGTGLFNFKNNAIAAVFTDIVKPDKPHKIIGLHTFRLNPGGDILKGPWTLQGSNKSGYETCQKTR